MKKTYSLALGLTLGIIWFASSACNSGPTRPPDTPIETPCPLANPDDPCWDREQPPEDATPAEGAEQGETP